MRAFYRSRDLTSLARFIGSSGDLKTAASMKALRKLPGHQEHLVLSAPATLACAIDDAQLCTVWPADRPLRIGVQDPRRLERLDGGVWFQYVPHMLRQKGDLEVIFFGGTGEPEPSQASPAIHRSGGFKTRHLSTSLHSFLDDGGVLDLVIRFSPIEHFMDEFFEDLIACSHRSIPFYFSSYSALQALLHHLICRAIGAEAQSVVTDSHFCLPSATGGVNWNRVLSKIPTTDIPRDRNGENQELIDSLPIAAVAVAATHMSGRLDQNALAGLQIQRGSIHTLDGLVVDIDSGRVTDLHEQRSVGHLSDQFAGLLSEYDPNWDDVDRFLWACFIRSFIAQDGLVPYVLEGAA